MTPAMKSYLTALCDPKLTPGPWEVSGTSVVTEEYCIAVIEDDGGYEAPGRNENLAFIAAARNADVIEWMLKYGNHDLDCRRKFSAWGAGYGPVDGPFECLCGFSADRAELERVLAVLKTQ